MAASLIKRYGSGQFVIDSNGILAFCLFKELHYINDHLSSLKAGLKIWLDFLNKIKELEEQFAQLEKNLETTLEEIGQFFETQFVNTGEGLQDCVVKAIAKFIFIFIQCKKVDLTPLIANSKSLLECKNTLIFLW